MKKISVSDIDLDDVFSFMEKGDASQAPEEIVYYLEMLDKVHKMHLRVLRFGNKEAILKHLILVDGLSRYEADKLYSEMLIYFYADNRISKQVWRNILFEKMYNNAVAAELLAQSTDDLSKVNKMYTEAGKMRQLDLVDPPEIPAEALQPPNKVYITDPSVFGGKKINRVLLARQIDELEGFDEAEKTLMKQEATIEPIILFPDESQVSPRSRQ